MYVSEGTVVQLKRTEKDPQEGLTWSDILSEDRSLNPQTLPITVCKVVVEPLFFLRPFFFFVLFESPFV